ncbi:MAG: GNAT family N-acetyltransferase [Thermodesulfobacteriota bacterium]|nr:GNAT family N-acetyltransferase [Thermodesulfobacteriota bacterium]
MIRKCTDSDFEVTLEIINDAAQAYKGVIPIDCWHEPYMSREELIREIEDQVCFWGFEEEDALIGIMGIQDKGDVILIRHAYVRSNKRNQGIGTRLLRFLESTTEKPILIGTWADATWAVGFYEKNGYRLLPEKEKNRLLRKYWTIPERQVITSVVLANKRWTSPTSR